MCVDYYKQFVYNCNVIRSFACKETERLFQGFKSLKLPQDIQKRAVIRLAQLDAAVKIDDLRLPPSNRLEALSGKLSGQWSIRINDQWRICFRFDIDGAHEVEITDYH
ncbi:MAG: type II toxin-antitoxin system RelE/ParE family toxin [Nitrospira sp.]|nr:type II toxin-antitoxin system RelE/ParE family toxin [Nitrospira sp.]